MGASHSIVAELRSTALEIEEILKASYGVRFHEVHRGSSCYGPLMPKCVPRLRAVRSLAAFARSVFDGSLYLSVSLTDHRHRQRLLRNTRRVERDRSFRDSVGDAVHVLSTTVRF